MGRFASALCHRVRDQPMHTYTWRLPHVGATMRKPFDSIAYESHKQTRYPGSVAPDNAQFAAQRGRLGPDRILNRVSFADLKSAVAAV
jgi:hypothetical protein